MTTWQVEAHDKHLNINNLQIGKINHSQMEMIPIKWLVAEGHDHELFTLKIKSQNTCWYPLRRRRWQSNQAQLWGLDLTDFSLENADELDTFTCVSQWPAFLAVYFDRSRLRPSMMFCFWLKNGGGTQGQLYALDVGPTIQHSSRDFGGPWHANVDQNQL